MTRGRTPVLSEHERRHRVLDAAATVFLRSGYASTTMDGVALAAGMSKKTLYLLYASKLALFDALLLDRLFDLPIPEEGGGDTQEERLVWIVEAGGRLLLAPERIALCRLIAVEGYKAGTLGSVLERLAQVRDMTWLERWLTAEVAAGRLPDRGVEAMATLLFGVTLAEPMLSLLLWRPIAASETCDCGQALAWRIRSGVRMFLVEMHAAGGPV